MVKHTTTDIKNLFLDPNNYRFLDNEDYGHIKDNKRFDAEIQNRLQAIFYIALQFASAEKDKAILNQIYKLGYPTTPYNFEHKNFDNLKNILEKVSEK